LVFVNYQDGECAVQAFNHIGKSQRQILGGLKFAGNQVSGNLAVGLARELCAFSDQLGF
jgi:hypothetical protein